jgi:poly(A) polymerase
VTALTNDAKFEITTLRKDVECDGRWANVEFTDKFEEDAQRRDFTINALSYCPVRQEIFDYCNGLAHLKNKQVIFIGDAEKRIQEDYLRILRFFRFSTIYADNFDAKGLLACKNYAPSLAKLSRERIVQEFDKILLAPKAIVTLKTMHPEIIANIFPSMHFALDLLEKAFAIKNKLEISLSADDINALLLHQNTNLNVLKFSNVRKKHIKEIAAFIACEKDEAEFLLKEMWINKKDVVIFVLISVLMQEISLEQGQKLLKIFKQRQIPSFEISGNTIKDLGFAGKEVGNMLNYLKKIWIRKDFQITSIELLACLKKY